MNDLPAFVKTITRLTFVILLICAAGWILFEAFRPYIAGFILGATASLINANFLSYKIRQLTQYLEENKGKRLNLGFLTRAAIAVLAVMAALKFPQINVMTTVAGFFFVPTATIFVGAVINKKE